MHIDRDIYSPTFSNRRYMNVSDEERNFLLNWGRQDSISYWAYYNRIRDLIECFDNLIHAFGYQWLNEDEENVLNMLDCVADAHQFDDTDVMWIFLKWIFPNDIMLDQFFHQWEWLIKSRLHKTDDRNFLNRLNKLSDYSDEITRG